MPSAEYLVVATSLRPGSHSRIMAGELVRAYETLGAKAALLDLRDLALPLCDADVAYEHSDVSKVSALVKGARVIVIATPVYNYHVSAATKNLIELTGSDWEDKIVGFLCAAGGDASYMAVMGLANSLMLDFRCVILPRFVYATGGDFADKKIASDEIRRRISELAELSLKLRQN